MSRIKFKKVDEIRCREDVWDHLIRVDNSKAAAELMEISEMAVSESENYSVNLEQSKRM